MGKDGDRAEHDDVQGGYDSCGAVARSHCGVVRDGGGGKGVVRRVEAYRLVGGLVGTRLVAPRR